MTSRHQDINCFNCFCQDSQPPQKKTLVFQVGPFKASWVEWPTYSHAGQSDKTFWKNPWSLELVLGSCLVLFVNGGTFLLSPSVSEVFRVFVAPTNLNQNLPQTDSVRSRLLVEICWGSLWKGSDSIAVWQKFPQVAGAAKKAKKKHLSFIDDNTRQSLQVNDKKPKKRPNFLTKPGGVRLLQKVRAYFADCSCLNISALPIAVWQKFPQVAQDPSPP